MSEECELEMIDGYGYAECHTHRMLFVTRQQAMEHLHDGDDEEDDVRGYSRSDLLFGGNW